MQEEPVLLGLACGGGTEPCPTSFSRLEAAQGDTVTCHCDIASQSSGTVWGDGLYTTDSAPCKAALHAGKLSGDQDVTMTVTHGCESYAAREKNGVKSSHWGSWSSSFYFAGGPAPECPPPGEDCPSSFPAAETELSCACPPTVVGSVWGTDLYTLDSNICAAAVHSGALTSGEGGQVTVNRVGGCAKYPGSEKNGITSSDWSAYEFSFTFPSQGAANSP